MPRIRIAPSILSADFARLGEEVQKVAAAGADLVHVDVMDGHFVPNLTIGPPVVAALRKVTDLPLDVHLMVHRPEDLLEAFIDAGADLLSVHVEACVHLQRTVARIRELGASPGVVLNPATPLCSLDYILGDVDFVMLMSVNPGFGGQSFIPAVLDKIRSLRRIVDRGGWSVDIEVDGGVSPSTIAEVARAGANVFVAGSAVFGREDYGEVIATMRRLAEEGA